MKKMLLVFVCLALSVLAACGQETKTSEAKDVLIVGTDATFAPFEFMKDGKIVGFDVDLTKAIAKEMGKKLEIKNVGWDPLFPSVQNGDVDFGMSGISITEKRKQTYDFSARYFESMLLMVTKKDRTLTSALELKSLKVGVQNGSTGQGAVEAIVGENAANIKKYENTTVAFMALKNGEVDVVVTDNTISNEYLKNNPQEPLKTVTDEKNFTPEYYGFMFEKGSDLRKDVDQALKTVIENGTYAKIYQQWFGVEPNVASLQ